MNQKLLGEVASITLGQAPPGTSYNNRAEGLPLIAGAGDFTGGLLRPTKFTTSPVKRSASGDIVLSIRASIGAKVWSDGVYCLGRGVAGIRPGPSLDANYLWHWLGHVANELRAKGRGATFLQVNRTDLAELRIALPSVPEQLRIAAILDVADALTTKRRRTLTYLDSLAKSLFRAMPEVDASPVHQLQDLAHVSSGITKGRRTAQPTSSVPYLAVANVQAGHLKLDGIKSIDATEDEIGRYALRDGDLVLTEGGDPDKLGRGTVWREEMPLCLHQNHIFRVRPDQRLIHSDFLSAYLASDPARAYFLRSAKQTTGIASINMTQLRKIPIPVPPIELQSEFVRRQLTITRQRLLVERAIAADEELMTALQARAFRGEL